MQGDESPIIPGVDIGPRLQEMLHYIFSAKTWGVKRAFFESRLKSMK